MREQEPKYRDTMVVDSKSRTFKRVLLEEENIIEMNNQAQEDIASGGKPKFRIELEEDGERIEGDDIWVKVA